MTGTLGTLADQSFRAALRAGTALAMMISAIAFVGA
jgi:hypothetical protein